jgi:cation diffusion facilitator family transporter
VVAITLTMMAAEIAGGTAFGSMALLADGWHMASHASALLVTLFAYAYARKHSSSGRYCFGTGKVGALGGFASAVGLGMVALYVLAVSLSRLGTLTTIRFDEAIGVAVLGLLVNIACALLLHQGSADSHDHHHHHGHHALHHHHSEAHLVPPATLEHGYSAHGRGAGPHGHHPVHADLNLRGAYLHVAADALTSVTAIAALVAGKLLGWAWMDPAMGIVGALLVARWSLELIRDTSGMLLDEEVHPSARSAVRTAIERVPGSRVTALRMWRIGPRRLAAAVSVEATEPRAPGHYKELLRGLGDLAHVLVEVTARRATRSMV